MRDIEELGKSKLASSAAASSPKKNSYDAIVIGSGVVGACVARELSKFANLDVLVLEREGDVSQGSSKANSGIVHGGYDAKHGSLKSQLELQGNLLYEEQCRELAVPFERVGSLVLSFTDRDDEELVRLLANGRANGVPGLELWPRSRVLEQEPHVSVGMRSALFCPGTGITSPYLFTMANCENAHANGVRFRFHAHVVGIRPAAGHHQVELSSGEVLIAPVVINCAGLYSDVLWRSTAAATSAPASASAFIVKPRKGEYLLLSKDQGHLANRVLFQAPTAKYGKGVLVTRTVHGNLLLGPSATDLDKNSSNMTDTDIGELAYVAWAARKSVPHLDTRAAIRSFAGVRAKSSTGDFVVRQEQMGLITCGGIDSPGLTAAPAIAKRVVEMLVVAGTGAGAAWELKRDWAGTRVDYGGGETEEDSGVVICKCEQVKERAIRDSIRRLAGMGGQPTPDSVKLRTRAGMGDCQGFRCHSLVQRLIEDECGGGEDKKEVASPKPPRRVRRAEMGRL